jgi:type IV pilus assembly protein PilZ
MASGDAEDSQDKRYDTRHPITLRVDYKRMNTFFADYAKNISKGGTFIRTGKPLDVGTEFNFVLTIPNRSEQLQLKGEVVWIIREDEAAGDKHAGMGIKFKFAEDAERQAVADAVERLMDEALGEHVSNKLLTRKKVEP